VRRYDIDSLENRDPRLMAFVADLLEPLLWRYFRPVVRGLHHVPDGATLFVGNHNAGLLTPDSFIFGFALYRRLGIDAVPYGLGHEVALQLPLINQLVVPLGAVRATHENAHRLFAAGRKVLVYPGGDLDAMRPFRHRHRVVFGPRRGYVRLALREGVPILPVVTEGAHAAYIVLDDGRWLARALRLDRLLRVKVWPIALSIPWGLTIGPPPPFFPLPTRITIEVLPPVRFDRTGPAAAEDDDFVEACHRTVHRRMQSALERLAAER
jgi:1-acyl-sn-glycerol-3-phosphate acyltransferase